MTRALLFLLCLLASLPAAADMYQDARNAELPAALYNLGAMSRDAANAMLPQARTNMDIDLVKPTANGTGVKTGADMIESVVGLGVGALGSYTPGAAICQEGFETCSIITAMGGNAANNLTTADHVTAFGYEACGGVTSEDRANDTCLGIDTLRFVTGGTSWYNTAVGTHSLVANATVAPRVVQFSTAVGYNSGQFAVGTWNTAIGTNTLAADNTAGLTGSYNTAVGAVALFSLTGTAANNTAVGYKAGLNMTTADDNTLMGWESGLALTTGTRHTFLGTMAGYTSVTANDATYVGYKSGLYAASSNNTGVGSNALKGIVGTPLTGDNNTAIGTNSLLNASAGATNNTGVGAGSCAAVTTGLNNTCVGYHAGFTNATTGSQNILIGPTADVPAAGDSNKLNIGNIITGSVGGGANSNYAGILQQRVSNKATSYTALASESSTLFTNAGAGGPVTITLPVPNIGHNFCFANNAVQVMTVAAAGGTQISLGTAITAAGGSISSSGRFYAVCLTAVSITQWIATSNTGWTLP